MASSEESWTYDGRIASFQSIPARRASTARGIKATKAVKWPHKFLSPEQLADAGFYFNPSTKENDNVTCFLCHKSIVGWEEDDDPVHEHLKLSPECGWAIIASIQAKNEELLRENPMSEKMIEARTATFANRWPHEHKKGWKCKTKQLVDAGWNFKPTPESDDWTACVYCELSLDGWEPSDDPMEQHLKRNPDCDFFTLIAELPHPAPKRKTAKARKPRASKASRLSTQSNLEDASEVPSYLEHTAQDDDSILTTATNTTSKSKTALEHTRKAPVKKTVRATRASRVSQNVIKPDATISLEEPSFQTAQDEDSVLTTATYATTTSQIVTQKTKAIVKKGGRKPKVKKEEPIEVSTVAPEPEDDDFEVKVPIKPKTARGRKRNSDEMEASVLSAVEKPASKRQATRITKASTADTSKKTRGRKVANEEAQDSVMSVDQPTEEAYVKEADRAMFESEPMQVNDDELEAELEAMAQSTPRARPKLEQIKDAIVTESSTPTHAERGSGDDNPMITTPHVPKQFDIFDAPKSEIKPSPAPTARDTTPSSPQSSDVENQPPSAKPSTIRATNSTALIPLAASTPQASPSKRNLINGLQSTETWAAVDLDEVFLDSPGNKENTASTHVSFGDAMDKAKQGSLSSLEKLMTVEAWIKYSAGLAEEKLRGECERMVSTFECEGGRAMRVLESIQCVD